MRKIDAAEWLLSLTTTRERAASIAGDLEQESGGRGLVWFWGNVLRTSATLTWRGFTEAPRHVTGLAIRALFAQLFYIAQPQFFLIVIHMAFQFQNGKPVGDPKIEAILVYLWSSFRCGKWLTRNAPRHEMVVWAASGLVRGCLSILLLLLLPAAWRPAYDASDAILDLVTTAAGVVFMLGGVKRQQSWAAITSAE